MTREDRQLELPKSMTDFYEAHQTMLRDLNHPRLKFTLDGRLLGDIGEFLVEKHFGMTLSTRRTKGVDGKAPNGWTVQVKATQSKESGPSFSPGEGSAVHLIFLWIDFRGKRAHVVYNGPEAPVRAMVKKAASYTVTLDLDEVRRKDASLAQNQRLPRLR